MGLGRSHQLTSHHVRLALLLLAVAAASAAQALITVHPWLSWVGFSLAAGLVWLRGRDKVAVRTREPQLETPAVPAAFWLLFSFGVGLCAVAGGAVVARAAPVVTHALWIAGMACLVLAAWRTKRGDRWRHRPWIEVIALVLLITACAGLFGWQLDTLPIDVHGDEAEVGLDALRLLESTPFNLFRTGWYRLPIFHAVPTTVGLELFGRDLLGVRATSAIIGTVTVALTFALARRLWNLEIAVLSALFLATGRYFIHLSRTGYHYIDTPCISVAVLLLFLVAWRERRLGPAVWCGIVLGLGMQTYYASRLIAPLLLVTWLLWLWRSDPLRRRERLAALLVTGIAAIATAAPMIGYFSDNWMDLWRRTIDTSLFSQSAAEHLVESFPGSSFAHIVLTQLGRALLLFNLTPDSSLQ
jgi:hypothetical protein